MHERAQPADACTYPGDGDGYADGGGCVGTTTAAACTAALEGEGCQTGYTGTPLAYCSTNGGEHALSGCTGVPIRIPPPFFQDAVGLFSLPKSWDVVRAVVLGVEAESTPHHSAMQTPMGVQLTAAMPARCRMQGQRAMMLLLQAPATRAPAAPVGLKSAASVKVVPLP